MFFVLSLIFMFIIFWVDFISTTLTSQDLDFLLPRFLGPYSSFPAISFNCFLSVTEATLTEQPSTAMPPQSVCSPMSTQSKRNADIQLKLCLLGKSLNYQPKINALFLSSQNTDAFSSKALTKNVTKDLFIKNYTLFLFSPFDFKILVLSLPHNLQFLL